MAKGSRDPNTRAASKKASQMPNKDRGKSTDRSNASKTGSDMNKQRNERLRRDTGGRL